MCHGSRPPSRPAASFALPAKNKDGAGGNTARGASSRRRRAFRSPRSGSTCRLPRATKADDSAKAKAAATVWKDLKAEAEKVAADQIARLERMMSEERRVDAAVFRSAFVSHPLVGHLARRLVWGTYDAAGALVAAFRVTEDRRFETVDDAPFTLGEHDRVGLVHPLVLSRADLSVWGSQLADYGILQPFAQIGRPIVTLDVAAVHTRHSGRTASSALLYGLRRYGWRVRADETGITGFTRRMGDLSCMLSLEPTLVSGESTQHRLSLSTSASEHARPPSTIQISELVLQLDSVVS